MGILRSEMAASDFQRLAMVVGLVLMAHASNDAVVALDDHVYGDQYSSAAVQAGQMGKEVADSTIKQLGGILERTLDGKAEPPTPTGFVQIPLRRHRDTSDSIIAMDHVTNQMTKSTDRNMRRSIQQMHLDEFVNTYRHPKDHKKLTHSRPTSDSAKVNQAIHTVVEAVHQADSLADNPRLDGSLDHVSISREELNMRMAARQQARDEARQAARARQLQVKPQAVHTHTHPKEREPTQQDQMTQKEEPDHVLNREEEKSHRLDANTSEDKETPKDNTGPGEAEAALITAEKEAVKAEEKVEVNVQVADEPKDYLDVTQKNSDMETGAKAADTSMHVKTGTSLHRAASTSVHVKTGSSLEKAGALSMNVKAGTSLQHAVDTTVHVKAGSSLHRAGSTSTNVKTGTSLHHATQTSVHAKEGSSLQHAVDTTVHVKAGSSLHRAGSTSTNVKTGTSLHHATQ